MNLANRLKNARIYMSLPILLGLTFSLYGSLNACAQGQPKIIVVYTTKDIPKNAIIKDEDLQETWVFQGKMPSNLVPCRNFAVGYRANYEIPEGLILTQNELSKGLPVIKPEQLNHTTCSQTFIVRTKKRLAAHTIIQASDLASASMNPFLAPKDCMRMAKLIGKKTKGTIEAGQIIVSEMIDAR